MAADARRAAALKEVEALRAKAAAQGAAGTGEVALGQVKQDAALAKSQEADALKAAAQQSEAEQQLLREQLAAAQKGAGGGDRLGLQLGLVALTGAAAVELALKRRPPPCDRSAPSACPP